MDRAGERVRVEEHREPDHDDERLQREVAHEQDPHAPRATSAEAADVAEDHDRDEREREAERLAAIAERAPERAQVLRRGVARDRDQDHVVEQDRPARDEAHELVERVAREHRRAAPVLVQRGALDVGHRRQPEQQRGRQEHERREAQRVPDDHAEGEVDRARERRVDDREQDRLADAARARSRASAPRARPRPRPRGPRRRSRAATPAHLDVSPQRARGDEQHAEQQPRREHARRPRRSPRRSAPGRSRPSAARARTCSPGAPVGRSSRAPSLLGTRRMRRVRRTAHAPSAQGRMRPAGVGACANPFEIELAPTMRASATGGSSGDQRNDQDRDDVRDLDHRVDRGPGGVLERVADGVAGDRRGVGF